MFVRLTARIVDAILVWEDRLRQTLLERQEVVQDFVRVHEPRLFEVNP